jgi:hypothetical protein
MRMRSTHKVSLSRRRNRHGTDHAEHEVLRDPRALPGAVDGLADWPLWSRMTSDVELLCADHLRWSLTP